MEHAELAQLNAAHDHRVEVDGMLKIERGLTLFERDLLMLQFIHERLDDRLHLEVLIADVIALRVQGDAEVLFLDTEVVVGHAGDHSADLKNAVGGRIAEITLDLAQLGGDHRLADGLDVGVGGVHQLDHAAVLDAQLLELVDIVPDVGVQLVQVIVLDEDILDAVLILFHRFGTGREQRRGRGVDLKVIVTIDTGDLLDDVRLDGNVLGGAP